MKRISLALAALLILFSFCSCGVSRSSVSAAESSAGTNPSFKQAAAAKSASRSIRQYITYSLPATLSDGGYRKELGSLGGNLFCLKSTGSCVAKKASDSTPPGWNSYGGAEMYYGLNCQFDRGQLTDVSSPWNHSEYLTKIKPVDHCRAPAAVVQVSFDLYTAAEASEKHVEDKNAETSTMWYVFFAKENSKIGYAVFLNAEHFSREDAMTLARSVKFSKDAFYSKTQQ